MVKHKRRRIGMEKEDDRDSKFYILQSEVTIESRQ